MSPGSSTTHALRRLQSQLLQRRFAALEPRFRLELLGLGLLVGAFVFWRVLAKRRDQPLDEDPSP